MKLQLKITKIETKEVETANTETTINKLYAEDSENGLPKICISTSSPLTDYKADQFIEISIDTSQKVLQEFNEVTGNEVKESDPMKVHLQELRDEKLQDDEEYRKDIADGLLNKEN